LEEESDAFADTAIEHGAWSIEHRVRGWRSAPLEVGGKARGGILECWNDGILGIANGKDCPGVSSSCTLFQTSIIPIFLSSLLDSGY
jgi:hypothetical protein